MAAERKPRRTGGANAPASSPGLARAPSSSRSAVARVASRIARTDVIASALPIAAGINTALTAARPATNSVAEPQTTKRASLHALPGYLLDDGNADFLRLVNERVRLGILAALAVNERLAFADLKSTLEVTDGNLSVHARKLEDAGYIVCRKRFLGRRPRTEFMLTARGRHGFERYLGHMESLIEQIKGRNS